MTNWQAIANTVPVRQHKPRKANGANNQLEFHIAPRLRYAVPDHIAMEAWKRLRERRQFKGML